MSVFGGEVLGNRMKKRLKPFDGGDQTAEDSVRAFNVQDGLRPDERYIFSKFLPELPAKILDLGCGCGRTAIPLAASGYDVTGLDVMVELLKIARSKNSPVHFVQGDARHLPFAEGSFDAVIFPWNGLDHINDVKERIAALEEIKRVLVPGGVLIYSSHNAMGFFGRLFRPPLLTKRAARFFIDQLLHPSGIFRWNTIWRDPALGLPRFYSAPPSCNVSTLKQRGWRVRAVLRSESPFDKAKLFRDVHVHYIAEKK